MEKLYIKIGRKPSASRFRDIVLRMRKQLVRDIANRVSLQGETVEELNRYYCFHLKPYAYNILVLRVISRQKDARELLPVLKRAERRMRADLRPVFNELETAIVDGRIVCLFNITTHRDSPETEAFKLAISRFFAEISTSPEFFGYDFIMGEGITAESVRDLDNCFMSAIQAMEFGIVYGLNKKYDSYELVQAYGNIMSILTTERRTRIKHYIETLDRERMKELLDDLFAISQEELTRSPGLAYLLPHKVLDLCSSAINELTLPSQEFSQIMDEQRKKIDDCLFLDEIKRITWEAVLAVFGWYEKTLSTGSSVTVSSVKAYMHRNFSRRLTLMEMAEHVRLNPQYLSVLFKKETGKSIVDYLTDIRIDRAKALLRDTNISILEIAGAVGYMDARYFSRVFKQRVGLRPTEYRKTALKAEEIS
ncbi:MAG: helix-turn-helix transcriptional regulator [Oscillospiraceae bacterium]